MISRLHANVVLENSGGGNWTFPRGSFGLDQPDGSVYHNVEPIHLTPWAGGTRPKQTVKFERVSTRESAATIGDGAKEALKLGVNVESFTVLEQQVWEASEKQKRNVLVRELAQIAAFWVVVFSVTYASSRDVLLGKQWWLAPTYALLGFVASIVAGAALFAWRDAQSK
jgi:hypothetical protein